MSELAESYLEFKAFRTFILPMIVLGFMGLCILLSKIMDWWDRRKKP